MESLICVYAADLLKRVAGISGVISTLFAAEHLGEALRKTHQQSGCSRAINTGLLYFRAWAWEQRAAAAQCLCCWHARSVLTNANTTQGTGLASPIVPWPPWRSPMTEVLHLYWVLLLFNKPRLLLLQEHYTKSGESIHKKMDDSLVLNLTWLLLCCQRTPGKQKN